MTPMALIRLATRMARHLRVSRDRSHFVVARYASRLDDVAPFETHRIQNLRTGQRLEYKRSVRIKMMQPTEYITAKKEELVAVAAAMIEGNLNLIEGVRKIASLRYKIEDPTNKIFTYFIAVDSETDHLPLGSMRVHCAPEYLKQADDEMERYLADERSGILKACHEIIQVYSHPFSLKEQ